MKRLFVLQIGVRTTFAIDVGFVEQPKCSISSQVGRWAVSQRPCQPFYTLRLHCE